MKVLLINAPVRVANEHARLTLPLGLAYIASALMDAGHRVSVVDFNVSGLDMLRLEGILRYERPQVVGISAVTETYPNALRIANAVKAFDPEITTVFGGAHPTIVPAAVLDEPSVDYVVVGPGEQAIVALLDALSSETAREGEYAKTPSLEALGQVPGLGYRDGADVRLNPRAGLPHPDALPLPARDLFPLAFYKEQFTLLTATGSCPYSCPFCSGAHVWQGRRRARSPESIMAELDLLIREYGATEIFFSDDIFTLNRRWVLRLMDALMQRPDRPRWGCATRVDLVDAELLGIMARAGCVGIQFGVESGSRTILDAVKGITREQVMEAVRAAVAVGIATTCSFMVPFPDDTPETLADTLNLMRDVQAAGATIMLNYTCPYPGTYFYEHAEELGLKIRADSWDEYDAKRPILETRNLTLAEVETAVANMAAALGLRKSIE